MGQLGPRGKVALLRAALTAPPRKRVAAVERTRADVQALDQQHGPATWNLLIQADAVTSDRPALPPPEGTLEQSVSTALSVRPIDQMRTLGVQADDGTVAALVASDQTRLETLDDALELLDRAETASGAEAGERALAICVERLAETVPVAETGVDAHPAMQLYRALVHGPRAVRPSSVLIEPLLKHVALVPDAAGLIELGPAQSLYLDVSSAYENGLGPPPTVEVYTALLRACAKQSTSGGVASALGLIEDMTSYARRLPDTELAELASDIMLKASARRDAFVLWEMVVKHYDDGRLMTRPAFDRLLRGYLDAPSAVLAPLTTMHTIIRKMRRANEPPGFQTYRSLILHYGRHDQRYLPDKPSLRPMGDIPAPGDPRALRQVHSILSVDPFFDPPTTLLNALIQAYSRSRAYDDAWRLWQSIVVSPQRCDWDHRTVTNVLDLCSHARTFQPARVWYMARAREADEQRKAGGFALDKHAWDTWVECLARLGSAGQLDLACDVVFGQMLGRPNIFQDPVEIQTEQRLRATGDIDAAVVPVRTDWVPAPAPDERTLAPLIKFAHARGGRDLFDWVRERIQADLPHLWDRVKHIGTLDWAQVREERWRSSWPDTIDHDEPWSERRVQK